MSTSRHGPVLVAKSPSLEHQIASMSISGAASSSSASASASTSAPAPQPLALSPKVLAYFEEQRKIGAQWPKNPYPMKYDIEKVYRVADGTGSDKCLASVDSRDWRQRELSIRITDAAIDILDEVLRKPIAEESVKTWYDPKRPSVAALKQTHIIEAVPFTRVPDFSKLPPAITRCERKRFPIDGKANTVLIGVSPATIQEIGVKVLSYGAKEPKHNPGPVLYKEIERRLFHLLSEMFRPEYVCVNWLANRRQKLSIKRFDGKDSIFNIGSPSSDLSCEEARRLIRQLGMNRQLVHSLWEAYIRDRRIPKEEVEIHVDTIEKGLTEERLGILSY